MSVECQLIINADDLGWASGRDRGIFRSVEQGLVTSVSLFANGANFAVAVAQLKHHDVGVGVHLNLSDGRALTGAIRGVTDSEGVFLGKQRSRAVFAEGRFDRQAVSHELHTQLQRVLDSGLRLDHIDSHQHMFLFPSLTPMMVELCHHFQIKATRLPLPAEAVVDDPPSPLGDELSLYRRYAVNMQQLIVRAQLFSPDALWGMPLLNRLDETTLLALLTMMKPGCWELMVHPGDEDEGMVFCGVERQREQQALIANTVRRAIDKYNITLTTFGGAQCIS